MAVRNMKIGCVILGKTIVHTQQALDSKNMDLSDCQKWDVAVDDIFMDHVKNLLLTALPKDCDYFFTQLCSESEVIDIDKADAYVVVPIGSITDVTFSTLYSKNKPVVYAILPYNEIWSYGAVYFPYSIRDFRQIDAYLGMPSDYYVSKNPEDLKNILFALNIRFRINNTRVLCVGEPMYEPFHSWNWGYEMVRLAQQKFKVEWEHISSDKFYKIFNNWNKEFHSNIANEIRENHLPQNYTTDRSVKMYEIFKKLIVEIGANAFTVNCLYSVVHTSCKTSSCYALSKLNDDGIVSACEADVTTLMNMLITSYTSQSPGFMLNPYLYPQDNKLFVSHCTSPRKHSYSNSKQDDINIYPYYEIPELPFGIQTLKEEGALATITGISHDKMDSMIIIRGNIRRNTAFPTCRTQLELDVRGDIREIAEKYQGRHWIMVYGDHSESIKRTNNVMGIETVIF